MLSFVRHVTTDAPVEEVHAYLSDFRNVGEWDPRARAVSRARRAGRVEPEYRCEVSFAGRTVPMRYTVIDLVPDERIEWIGDSSWVRAHDVIRLRERGGATEVEYTTQYRYRRVGWLLDRLLGPAVSRLCDDARDGLQATLDRRSGATG